MLNRLLLPFLFVTQLASAQSDQDAAHGGTALAGMVHKIEAEPMPGSSVEHEEALVDSLYAAPDVRLLWSEHGQLKRQTRELLDILNSSDVYGLHPGDYGADSLPVFAAQLSGQSPTDDWQRFDIRLSRAAIRLITQLHFGRIDPRAAGFELTPPRDYFNAASVVSQIAVAPKVLDAVTAVEPRFYHYALLKAALAKYRVLATGTPL
jgi:murein L,D-transpeptidase YcbB/YkuD